MKTLVNILIMRWFTYLSKVDCSFSSILQYFVGFTYESNDMTCDLALDLNCFEASGFS